MKEIGISIAELFGVALPIIAIGFYVIKRFLSNRTYKERNIGTIFTVIWAVASGYFFGCAAIRIYHQIQVMKIF